MLLFNISNEGKQETGSRERSLGLPCSLPSPRTTGCTTLISRQNRKVLPVDSRPQSKEAEKAESKATSHASGQAQSKAMTSPVPAPNQKTWPCWCLPNWKTWLCWLQALIEGDQEMKIEGSSCPNWKTLIFLAFILFFAFIFSCTSIWL